MTHKLWGGRFKDALSASSVALSYSVHIDKRLVDYDIRVNLAHAKALVKAAIFSQEEYERIKTCLTELAQQFKQQDHKLIQADEDIHSCIERLVTERLGELGKRLHTGKSRNDQVITDSRLFIKDQCVHIKGLLKQLLMALLNLATRYEEVIFPGFTHFQPALPVLFAHHLLAYVEKFKRDHKRFSAVYETADVSALGSGALAGHNYSLDRVAIAKDLGFSTITLNSMDAVSDRDFILEFLAASSFCMTHLSRFCEEIIIWNSPILGFIQVGDAFSTGSSIMPQKKNPDMAELIRGKAGRVLGHLVSLQHILKALPLTYNRDLQEDKEAMFDSADTLDLCLRCFAEMLDSIQLHEDSIKKALNKGYLLATDFADYLVKKGLSFRDSHDITGKTVLYAIENGKNLEQLSIDEFKQFSTQVDTDVYKALSLNASINAKNVVGGTARHQVATQLKQAKEAVAML